MLVCSFLNFFSISLFLFWACRFEKSIENFLILYLRNSYLAWKSVVPFCKVSRVAFMWNSILVTKLAFMLKELLNFQSPLPLFSTLHKSRGNSKGESTVKKAFNTSLLTDSCSWLEMKKQSSFLWINPDICCFREIKHVILEFLILHMSHELNILLIWINFVSDFFYKHGFPSKLSILISNIRLKSPPRTIFLFWINFTFPKIFTRSERVSSCSKSVLAL